MVVIDFVYLVYVDSNVMVGCIGEVGEIGCYVGLIYLLISVDNGFVV